MAPPLRQVIRMERFSASSTEIGSAGRDDLQASPLQPPSHHPPGKVGRNISSLLGSVRIDRYTQNSTPDILILGFLIN